MNTVIMHIDSSPKRAITLITYLTRAENSALFLTAALLVSYVALPIVIAPTSDNGTYLVELARVSLLAAICVWLGSKISLFDKILSGMAPRVIINADILIVMVWAAFVVFVLTAWLTTSQIPILAALGGADSETVAMLRELFLKGREGWQASFVYINAILSGAILPYSIALMFVQKRPSRWFAFAFFLVFSISFIEKAFFLKATLPLLFLIAQRRIRVPVSPTTLMWMMLALLGLLTFFSGAGTADIDSNDEFFSTTYVPQSPLDHLLWRSIAIPLLTAADAVRVLYESFNGEVLMGATSSLIAGLAGMERIEFERMVFAAQWGQNETGTGSANSVFITEAYVNFGWLGTALISLFVGLLMRFFAKSSDDAFRSLWILFAFGLYTSGLFGLMFSNGFVLLFVLIACFKFRRPGAGSDSTQSASKVNRIQPQPITGN